MSCLTPTPNESPKGKTLELDCGIAPTRIVSWLEEELMLGQDGHGAYVFDRDGQSCAATVTALGKSGRFALERTLLVVSGDEPTVEAFMHLFTLRFLSAGG